MLFRITLAMGPASAHLAWNTVVQRVSADGRAVLRKPIGQRDAAHRPIGSHLFGRDAG